MADTDVARTHSWRLHERDAADDDAASTTSSAVGGAGSEAETAGTVAMDSEATMTLWEQRGLLAEPLRRGYERRWHHGAGARKYNHLRDAVRAMFEVDADGEGSPREAIFATLAVAHAVAENVGGHPNSALLRRCICAAVSHLGSEDGRQLVFHGECDYERDDKTKDEMVTNNNGVRRQQ